MSSFVRRFLLAIGCLLSMFLPVTPLFAQGPAADRHFESLHGDGNRDTLVARGLGTSGEQIGIHLSNVPDPREQLIGVLDSSVLRVVEMQGTQFGDKECEVLKGNEFIEELCLVGTCVTDHGLSHLRRVARLKSLDLRGTRVTDEGLLQLVDHAELRMLDVRGTAVTPAGVNRFRVCNPRISLLWDGMRCRASLLLVGNEPAPFSLPAGIGEHAR